MNTERFIHQATRGLWGQKKRDVTLELRGAIEDKVWRHQLRGLNPADAEQAALRDLGSPHTLARDLNRVHTSPTVLRSVLLMGVAGLLSLQAAAQLPTVQAAPTPVSETCRFDAARLARFAPEDRARIEAQIRAAGGQAAFEAACRSKSPGADLNNLLRLADLIKGLRAANIEVQTLPGLDAYLQLRLPGQNWQGVNLTGAAVPVRTAAGATDLYVDAAGLVNLMRGTFKGTLSLSGTVNPILHIGPAKMQVGTPERPVYATDLSILAVTEELMNRMMAISPGTAKLPRTFSGSALQPVQGGSAVALRNGAQSLYAVLGTIDGELALMVQTPRQDRLALCGCRLPAMSVTQDLNTLLKWSRENTPGVMVFALNVTNLHHPRLTPVPAAQLQVVPQ
jgi:hypothetical protein